MARLLHFILACIFVAVGAGPALLRSSVTTGRMLTIVGLVDTSTLSSISTANLYITLSAARDIVTTAPGVATIHTFGPQDSNLLFIQAARDKTEDVAGKIKQILGEKITVSTPNSCKQLLGSLFTLTQRFSGMISGMVFLLAHWWTFTGTEGTDWTYADHGLAEKRSPFQLLR